MISYHFILILESTHRQFREWRQNNLICPQLTGVWNRPLFVGGMDHTTDLDERVFNIQTPSMFIDLRIPTQRPQFARMGHRSTATLSDEQLRVFARQHCFSGYSLLTDQDPPVVARHHMLDWNFVGVMRSRPNKWRVEMDEATNDTWQEWSFAKDDFGQHYYLERWERREADARGKGRVLALRTVEDSAREKVLIVCGDHFQYARARVGSQNKNPHGEYPSLIALVDDLLSKEDRAGAEAYLTLEGGHGMVDENMCWIVDTATHPWQEGSTMAEMTYTNVEAEVVETTQGPEFLGWTVSFGGDRWEVLESSFQNISEVKNFLQHSANATNKYLRNYHPKSRL